MNILLINHYAGSVELGMEYRPFYMAEGWVKAGHKVTIIAADHSHLRLKNPHIDEDFEEKKADGITYCWVKTPEYTHGISGRGRNVFTFLSKLLVRHKKLAEKYSPDVVIASSTYPFDVYPASKIAKLCSAPLVWEVHDLWPLTQTALYSYSTTNPLVKTIEAAQRYALKNAAKVVSIIPKSDDYLKSYGLDASKYVHIPNGVALNIKPKTPPSSYLKIISEAKQSGKFIVLYCGSVGRSNALDQLVSASALLKGKAEIIIVGNGGYRVMLKRAIKEMELDNVHLLDAISFEQAKSLMKEADCLYLGANDSPLYAYGIGMNKLFDYMLSGKPVLLAIDCGFNPVKAAGCGVCLGGCSADIIADGIKDLMKHSKTELEEMGKKGVEYVIANHDYAKLSKKFLDLLKEIAKK